MTGPTYLYQGPDQPEYRSFGIDGVAIDGGRLQVKQVEISGTPFLKLREFQIEDQADRPAVLVVPPLSGHFPVLLRDMVLGFLLNFRVAILDWANVRHVPVGRGAFGFDDNIAAIAAAICRFSPQLSVIALCQAAVPTLAAVSDLAIVAPEHAPSALVLIAAPIDPLANPTAVVRLICGRSVHWYRIVPIASVPSDHEGRGRWVYPADTQLAALHVFLARQVEGNTELAHKISGDDGADPVHFPFLDLYTSVMDLDARHFVENIDRVFLRRCLPRGELRFRDRPVDPGSIRRTALATVEGELDEIAAPGQTSAAHRLCTGLPDALRLREVVSNCGHFSLFHGDVWRNCVLPMVTEYCQKHAAN